MLLKVSIIERDTIEPDSIYTKEQLGQENYQFYFTLDQISLGNYPRVKSDYMDFPERIGISNSKQFEKLLGPAGSKGSLEGIFSHFKLVYTPHKPAEGSIELNKATVEKK
jgi:hypothetical protein